MFGVRTGWAKARHRLNSSLAGTSRRPDAPSRIDSAWLLGDGSMAVEGWSLSRWKNDEPLMARIKAASGSPTEPWSPLLRKHRPDVARELLDFESAPVGQANFGFVGHLKTAQDLAKPAAIELKQGNRVWTLIAPDTIADVVPEDLFAFIDVDPTGITQAILAPITGIVRHSIRPKQAAASLLYQHPSFAHEASINIVVPVYGQWRFLRNLLLAISQCSPILLGLTVVCDDPAIQDDLRAWLTEWNDAVYRAPVRLLAHHENSGFASACNSGWVDSRAAYQLLLNSDVLISDPVADLTTLVSHIEAGATAVAPVLLFPDGSLQHAGMEMQESSEFPPFILPMHPGKGASCEHLGHDAFDVPLLSGAAILTTTEALRDVGGVPIVFGRGDFEDVMLSVSLCKRGPLTVDPAVRWTHVEAGSYQRQFHGGIPLTLAKSLVALEELGHRL